MSPRCLLLLAALLPACTLPFSDPEPAPSETGGRVVGSVVLPDGFDAEILSRGQVELLGGDEVRTAALGDEGGFAFEGVPAGSYSLEVRLRGFSGGIDAVEVAEQETSEVGEVALEVTARGTAVGIAKLDGAGEHAGIVVEAEGTGLVTTTDLDGNYRLQTTPGVQVLRFSYPGYAGGTASVTVAADQVAAVEPVLLAAKPGRVLGTVSLPPELAGTDALDAARVVLENADATREATPSDGRFDFESVPAGAYTLHVEHPDLVAPPPSDIRVPIGAVFTAGDLALQLPAEPARGTIEGYARREGAPEDGHAGVAVEAVGADFRAATAADGFWSLALPPLESGYTIRFVSTGYESRTVEVPSLAEGEVVETEATVLPALTGAVHGVLNLRSPEGALREFDEALRLSTVLRLQGLDGEPLTTAPALDGAFRFEDVAQGSYTLTIELVGFGVPPVDGIGVAVGEVVNLGSIELLPIIDSAIRGRALRGCPGECDHGGIRVEARGTPFVAFTGADGDYTLDINQGRFDLRFTATGYGITERNGVEVAGVERLDDVVLELVPARVTGQVGRRTRGGVEPAGGARVVALEAEAPIAETVADENGLFSLELAVERGTRTFRVELDRHESARLDLPVAPAERTDAGRVVLEPLIGTLSGRVLRPEPGQPATVYVRGDVADPLTAATALRVPALGADEAFEVVELVAGAYEITAAAAGHRAPDWAPVVVEPEGTRVELALTPLRAGVEVGPVVGREAVARFEVDPQLSVVRWGVDAPPAGDFVPLGDALPLDFADVEEGPHTLRFELADAAWLADPSDPFAARVVLARAVVVDKDPPRAPDFELAGGQERVNALVVPVTFANADEADTATMAVWNAADCEAAPVDCPGGDPRLRAFTTASTHVLEPPEGPKNVCWTVCDAACNCRPPTASPVTLGPYVARPTPSLDGLEPDSLDLRRPEPLVLSGVGLADDTRVVIGVESFPCALDRAGDACRAADGGGCDADCAARCGTRCTVALDDDALFLGSGGTYPVRLETPAPVADDQGLSAPQFLSVVSPVPRIDSVSPGGAFIADLTRPDLLGQFTRGPNIDRFDIPPVFPEHIAVTVRACDVAANTQYRLGPAAGRLAQCEVVEQEVELNVALREACGPGCPEGGVCRADGDCPAGFACDDARCEDPRLLDVERTACAHLDDPRNPAAEVPLAGISLDGPCGAREITRSLLVFDTLNLPRLPEEQQHIVAVNPAPGGGEGSARFGVNEFEVDCATRGLCVLPLSSSSPPTQGAAGTFAAAQLDQRRKFAGIGWWGSELAELRRRYGEPDLEPVILDRDRILPRMLTRVFAETAGGLLPGPAADSYAVGLFDGRGKQPIAGFRAVTRRGDGRFAAPLDDGVPIVRVPEQIVASDFDGDGQIDLAFASCQASGVSVRLGLGDGTFAPGEDVPMSSCPIRVRTADFDGDGAPDLVALGGEAESTLAIRRGLDDGRFSLDLEYPVEDDGIPTDLAVTDLDEDGRVDAVVVTDSGHIVWRYGLGDGRLGAQNTHAADASLGAVAITDLDADQREDLVAVRDTPGQPFVLLGSGRRDQPFTRVAAGLPNLHGHTQVALGDLNADGAPDLVAAGEASVQVALGRGDGRFAPASLLDALAHRAQSLHLNDLNGDGHADVVVGLEGTARLYAGDGQGGFAEGVDIDLETGIRTPIELADLNGDGALDLVSGRGRRDSRANVLLAIGARAFPEGRLTVPTTAAPAVVEAADVNRDGHPDVVTLHESGSIGVALGDGEGRFAEPTLTGLPGEGRGLAVGDLDGDGWPDALVTVNGRDRMWVALGTPDGLRRPGNPIPLRCSPQQGCADLVETRSRRRVRLGDVDDDGELEVLVTCGADVLQLDGWNGRGFDREEVIRVGSCADDFELLDVDGRWGVVTFGPRGTDEARVHFDGRSYDLNIGWVSSYLAVLDLNGDGRDTLIAVSMAHDRDDGDGRDRTLTRDWPGPGVVDIEQLRAEADEEWRLENLGGGYIASDTFLEFNGDDRPDYAQIDPELGSVRMRVARGDRQDPWDPIQDFELPSGARSVYLGHADLDRNGTRDLMVAREAADDVALWMTPHEGRWTVHLSEPVEDPSVRDEPRTFEVWQGTMYAERLGLRVRLDGANLDQASMRLRSPGGESLDLGSGPADADTWHVVIPATEDGPMAEMGRDPRNEAWTLTVTPPPGAELTLRRFMVTAYGPYFQREPGSRAERPKRVVFAPEANGRRLKSSTLGGLDTADLSCANTDAGGASPERWFEVEVPEDNTLSVRAPAAFEAAVELRPGACREGRPAVACAVGVAATPFTAVSAGTWCVVVDGVADGPLGQSGHFELVLRLGEPVGGCAPDCEPEPDPRAGVVDCDGDLCDLEFEQCCIGLGAGCAARCGFTRPVSVTCDGPEDCAAGDVCCGDENGARCAADCGGNEVCHEDPDCSAGTCEVCEVQGNDVNLCVEDACP